MLEAVDIRESVHTSANVDKRSLSLDALRGMAMLLMVLSGSIAFGGVLPNWMYHAQVPPPAHVFKPELPGITWVDLVFPFFLFAMGAAFPLALKRRLAQQSLLKTAFDIFQRYILLIFFAIFTLHARAWSMNSTPGALENMLSIECFFLLFLIYSQQKGLISKKFEVICRVTGISLALLFLSFYPFRNGSFSFYQSDIIIIVLANMALFGSLIWILTRNKPFYRIAILPFIMAVFLTGSDNTSWNSILFNWTPIPWMYKFYYLKYLFIIIPGTFAGEWLIQLSTSPKIVVLNRKRELLIALGSLTLLVTNLIFLFNRALVLNLAVTALLSIALVYLTKRSFFTSETHLVSFLSSGIYLLMLGLFFEAYEGGIKKDPSTYSYYFISSGLAFLALLSFIIFERLGYFSPVLKYLAENGKNPMIIYTAGNLLLIPVLNLTGAQALLATLNGSSAGGFLRGVIFTGIVSLITVACTKRKIFWRT